MRNDAINNFLLFQFAHVIDVARFMKLGLAPTVALGPL